MTTTTPAIPTRTHLEAFFSRVNPISGRIILAIDATASRERRWDTASHLQAQMFETVSAVGKLDVQLVYYRGYSECVASRWQSNAESLAAVMARVTCAAGHTQIRKVLAHARKENAREKINALIIVSDACEETPHDLYAEARELDGVPVFMFQEGSDEHVGKIYAEIARLTGGAHCKFDGGATQRLADLLKAVATFATGGIRALADQKTEAARLLLTQVKKP
jgi:hypothetical protein